MRHYLFECVSGECEGDEFLVGADTVIEAEDIAEDNFGQARCVCELTEFEAESSGLDEEKAFVINRWKDFFDWYYEMVIK